jgi:hypothetical protein
LLNLKRSYSIIALYTHTHTHTCDSLNFIVCKWDMTFLKGCCWEILRDCNRIVLTWTTTTMSSSILFCKMHTQKHTHMHIGWARPSMMMMFYPHSYLHALIIMLDNECPLPSQRPFLGCEEKHGECLRSEDECVFFCLKNVTSSNSTKNLRFKWEWLCISIPYSMPFILALGFLFHYYYFDWLFWFSSLVFLHFASTCLVLNCGWIFILV